MNEDELLAHLMQGCRAAGAKNGKEAADMLVRRGLGSWVLRRNGRMVFKLDVPKARQFIEEAHAPEKGIA